MFRQLESLTAADQGQLDQLRQRIFHYGRVCVAYSGGVDSALVAAIAQEQLAEAAIAVTGISPALAPHLREEARLQAQWLGIAHQEVMTAELQDPAYASNPADRCYACKRELHRHLADISRAAAGAQVPMALTTMTSVTIAQASMPPEKRAFAHLWLNCRLIKRRCVACRKRWDSPGGTSQHSPVWRRVSPMAKASRLHA